MSYTDGLCHYYDMSVPVGLPDLGIPGGNPGVGVNIASNPNGIGGGICAEFNGNNSYYNLGSIAELNTASEFTIAFWALQDVIDQDDLFLLFQTGTDYIQANSRAVDGSLRIYLTVGGATAYGWFDYSTVMNAGQWHHLAIVFDGSQAGNATRLVVYVDAVPMTLAFVGAAIPALTGTMGADLIGSGSTSLDGKIDSFGIFSQPLTQLQVQDFLLRTRRGVL